MRYIHAEYNPLHNSIDVNYYEGYILRFDCNMIEEGIVTTPGTQCELNALAVDEPLEYLRMYLEGSMQSWLDCGECGV